MSSLLDLHLDKVPDLTALPADQYQLKVGDAKIVPSKSSERDLISVIFSINDHAEAKAVFHNFCIPIKTDKESTVMMFKRDLKNFLLAFGVDPSDPGDPAEWKGLEGWATLKHGTNNRSGEEENTIGRWIIPK